MKCNSISTLEVASKLVRLLRRFFLLINKTIHMPLLTSGLLTSVLKQDSAVLSPKPSVSFKLLYHLFLCFLNVFSLKCSLGFVPNVLRYSFCFYISPLKRFSIKILLLTINIQLMI